MGYTFTCDSCAEGYDHAPAFMGEFRESFLKTSDSPLTQVYQPGQTITLCRGCMQEILL